MGIIYPSSMLSKPRGLVASGFDPISAFGSDLALWLDPSYGVYTDRSTQLTAASSQYWSVAHNSSLRFTTAMSLSFWVYRDTDANDQCFLGKWTYNTDGGWGIQSTSDGVGNTGIRVYLATSVTDDGTGCSIEFAAAGVTHAAWHHVCLIFDGTLTGNANRAKLYVDGVQKTLAMNAGAVPASLVADTADLNIGKFGGALLRYMNGRMDSVRIWGRAISATDVASEYNAGAGKVYADLTAAEQVSLVSAFDFDGDGLDAHGSNDLTAVNSPTFTAGIASGIAGDGDVVSLWTNRGTAGAISSVGYASRAIFGYNSGKPRLRFDGTSDYYALPTLPKTPHTVAIAFKNTSAPAIGAFRMPISPTGIEVGVFNAVSGYTDVSLHNTNGAGTAVGFNDADAIGTSRANALVACFSGDWTVGADNSDPTKYAAFFNGSERAIVASGSFGGGSSGHVGSRNGIFLHHGDIFDVVVIDRVLTLAERAQLGNWLLSRCA